MKGLLLKDFYMIIKYCRMYFLIAAVIIVVSFASDRNLFFIFYPCLLSGMIPVTLLAYDERSRWNEYIGTLPYTKAQIVSGKYIIGLSVQLFVILLSGVVQGVRMYTDIDFYMKDYIVLMASLFILSSVTSSMCLPFVFKWGVEKGRIAYYVMIVLGWGGAFAAQTILKVETQSEISPGAVLPVLCIAGILLYALSWYLSVVFYKKREIK